MRSRVGLAGARVAITPPHRRRYRCWVRCRAACRSRSATGPRPRPERRAHDLETVAAHRRGRGDVLGVVDGLMFGPDPLVIGDQLAVAEHPDAVQVSGDLDPPPNHRRAPSSRCRPGARSDHAAIASRTATRASAGPVAGRASLPDRHRRGRHPSPTIATDGCG
jgi:hypothetical protein